MLHAPSLDRVGVLARTREPRYDPRPRVDAFGDLSTVSFYPARRIAMGEGGCVPADRPLLGTLVESFRDWGRDCSCEPGNRNPCGKPGLSAAMLHSMLDSLRGIPGKLAGSSAPSVPAGKQH